MRTGSFQIEFPPVHGICIFEGGQNVPTAKVFPLASIKLAFVEFELWSKSKSIKILSNMGFYTYSLHNVVFSLFVAILSDFLAKESLCKVGLRQFRDP